MNELDNKVIEAEFEAIWQRKYPNDRGLEDMKATALQWFRVGYGQGGIRALEMSHQQKTPLSKIISHDLRALLQ